jgi:hypothetical protein
MTPAACRGYLDEEDHATSLARQGSVTIKSPSDLIVDPSKQTKQMKHVGTATSMTRWKGRASNFAWSCPFSWLKFLLA